MWQAQTMLVVSQPPTPSVTGSSARSSTLWRILIIISRVVYNAWWWVCNLINHPLNIKFSLYPFILSVFHGHTWCSVSVVPHPWNVSVSPWPSVSPLSCPWMQSSFNTSRLPRRMASRVEANYFRLDCTWTRWQCHRFPGQLCELFWYSDKSLHLWVYC